MTTRRQTLLRTLDPYRVTSHGANPWSNEALLNVIATREHMDAARVAVNGYFSSVYRSPPVNRIVGGSANSRHLRGLAADIIPRAPWSVKEAAHLLWEMAQREELGLVQQVIWEPSWVHVGWYAVSEQDRGMTLLRMQGGKYERLSTWTDESSTAA